MQLTKGQTDTDSAVSSNVKFTYEDELGGRKRRNLSVSFGRLPFYNPNNVALPIYPIPIKKGASQAVVTVTPSTQYIYLEAKAINQEGTKYYSAGGQGWAQGQSTVNLTNNDDERFLCLNLKYDNSGTTYPTEPTSIRVTFN